MNDSDIYLLQFLFIWGTANTISRSLWGVLSKYAYVKTMLLACDKMPVHIHRIFMVSPCLNKKLEILVKNMPSRNESIYSYGFVVRFITCGSYIPYCYYMCIYSQQYLASSLMIFGFLEIKYISWLCIYIYVYINIYVKIQVTTNIPLRYINIKAQWLQSVCLYVSLNMTCLLTLLIYM